MDAKYMSEIENPSIKRKLLAVENIPAIEDLLDRESQKLDRLQKLKGEGKLDFGDKVSPEELRELSLSICAKVDDFLNIRDGDVPNFGYFNLFKLGPLSTPILSSYSVSALGIYGATSLFTSQNPGMLYAGVGLGILQFAATALAHIIVKSPNYLPPFKEVTLEKVARTNLIIIAGHEYTHHIQVGEGLRSRKYSIFKEGHARGVEKQLADVYHKSEDNESFLYDTLDRTVGELKSAYLWMCKKLGKQPRESLLETKNPRDSGERLCRLLGEPTHALGNALLSIYEEQEGREIYTDMIHGDFQFA